MQSVIMPFRVEVQEATDQWHATHFPTKGQAAGYAERQVEDGAHRAIVVDQSKVDPVLIGTHPTPGEVVEEFGWMPDFSR